MENDEKNIDRLFQERFKDFEAFPEEAVWDNIQAKLDEEDDSKKTPLIPWWLGRSAAIALLLIGLGLMTYFLPSVNTQDIEVVDTPTNSKMDINTSTNKNIDSTTEDAVVTSNTEETTNNIPESINSKVGSIEGATTNATVSKQNEEVVYTDKNTFNTGKNASRKYTFQKNNYSAKYSDDKAFKTKQPFDYPTNTNTDNEEVIATITTTENTKNKESQKAPIVTNEELLNNNFVIDTNQVVKTNSAIALATVDSIIAAEDEEEALTLEEAIKLQEDKYKDEDEEEEEDDVAGMKKWSVNPNVAPVYFNSFSNGSPISSEFAGNTKNGNLNMSYGVNVGLQVNKKLKIRSGINKVEYGYTTDDIYFTNSVTNSKSVSSINYSNSGATVLLTNNSTNYSASPNPNGGLIDVSESSASVEKSRGSLIQNMNYLEFPVELEYSIVNKKLGINVIGGVSTLLLSNDEILLESDGLVTNIGNANNINDLNFSTNIGLGIDYKFTDQLLFNIEPMFKYQLNTFSDDNGFNPYSLGLYTGFSFRF
ncbi:hypothetical protein [Neptunitalea lumnitzerae]|uniref:Outer membrane protein beta-barrel domain-containing protein n=1 Tax=Neptunitalea lumnitzerae TaxID=2965509 RepID=A0ABQ5MF93_9FLAO|nr:hypothetical protein [Neptunitalea sp. Y10]GLB48094.1 hypothetical protein Y10_04620 [Neptunitalea sp. Y10]